MATAEDGKTRRLDELGVTLADLAGVLESAPETDGFLEAVCAEAVRVVPGADMASVTRIGDGDRGTTVAATDERALRLDRVQYDVGEGPCLEAAETGQIVRVSIAEAGQLWPEFAAAAEEIGVCSHLAAPLRVDENLVGSINLFGFGAHGYHEFDATVLRLYTFSVESALRFARRYQQAQRLAEDLNAAMRTRAVIEQAKGMLMLVHRIDDEAAMQLLITESQHSNTKLRDVAARFVQRVTRAPGK